MQIKNICAHTIKHYKHVLYSNSKRGIKNTLNAKIKELSIALDNLQQNANSRISELSDAMNIQQKESNDKADMANKLK